MEIEIVHRRSPGADVEAFSINLQAMPSFEAFGRYLGTANPLAFWAHALQLAWLPWLGATRALTLPWNAGAALQPPRLKSSLGFQRAGTISCADGVAAAPIASERWSSRKVRQQAEPPLRKKACSGVCTTV